MIGHEHHFSFTLWTLSEVHDMYDGTTSLLSKSTGAAGATAGMLAEAALLSTSTGAAGATAGLLAEAAYWLPLPELAGRRSEPGDDETSCRDHS